MSLAERLIVWVLAKGISGGEALAVRVAFDARYKNRSEEWRRDIWTQAAERAANVSHKTSREA